MGIDRQLIIGGVKPADELWKQMKTIYDSCIALDVEVPVKVKQYFNNEEPVDEGVLVPLIAMDVGRNPGEYSEEQVEVQDLVVGVITENSPDCGNSSYGCTIDLRKIPEDVKILRITVESSW